MRTVRQLCTVLALAAGMLMLAAGTALAQRPPAEPFAPAAPQGVTSVLPTVTHTTSGGIPGWAIALIAVAAAVVAILATEVTHSVLRRRHA
jgi:hypothetical protein